MEIANNRLKDAKYVQAAIHGNKFKAGFPDTIVIHFTAGPNGASTVNYFKGKYARASAHLVVDTDGSVTQMVPFDTVAWHAGPSSFNGRTGYNFFSIGIEIVNKGWLKKSGSVFRGHYGATYKAEEVVEGEHRNPKFHYLKYWHAYTPEQIEAVKQICISLMETYNIKHIVGHEEITKGKSDPGPAFPLDKMRNELLGSGRDQNGPDTDIGKDMKVTASQLNFRTEPSLSAQKAGPPLVRGTKVKVVETQGQWAKIKVEVEGWVAAKYISE